MSIPYVILPDWADTIAIDADGSMYAFEGGAFYSEERGQWIPVDEFDGLRYRIIGKLHLAPGKKQAGKMIFTWGTGYPEGENIEYTSDPFNLEDGTPF